MKKIAFNIFIPLLVTFVMFVVLEGSLCLFWPQNNICDSLSLQQTGMGNPHQIYRDVYRIVSGPEYRYTRMLTTQGFRDDKLYSEYPQGDTVRVLLIGDSFTYGAGLEFADTWGNILEDSLQAAGYPVELIKAGVSSFQTSHEVLNMERLVPLYHPDIVLVTFMAHDFYWNKAPGTPTLDDPAEASLEERKGLGLAIGKNDLRMMNTVTLMERIVYHNDQSYVNIYMFTPRKAYFIYPPTEVSLQNMEVTRYWIERANALADSFDFCLSFMSLPQQFQYIIARDDNIHSSEELDIYWIDRHMNEFADSLGITWVPMLDAFADDYRERGENHYFRLDGHINATGAAFYAHELFNRRQVWSCGQLE